MLSPSIKGNRVTLVSFFLTEIKLFKYKTFSSLGDIPHEDKKGLMRSRFSFERTKFRESLFLENIFLKKLILTSSV